MEEVKIETKVGSYRITIRGKEVAWVFPLDKEVVIEEGCLSYEEFEAIVKAIEEVKDKND